MSDRDVAIVLSGGGMNGVLLELGFLKRLRESSLWPRIGSIYGTSAGALTGSMAALDRLDEMEEFALSLQPRDVFCPQRLWRLPLNGLHEYSLPATIAERLFDPLDLARSLAAAPIELVVYATDVSEEDDGAYALCSLFVSRGAAGDHGPGRLRLGGDQRGRPAAACRGPDRDRRRLGPELPALERARPARRSSSSWPSVTSRATATSVASHWHAFAGACTLFAPSHRCAHSSPSSTKRRRASCAVSPSTWAT